MIILDTSLALSRIIGSKEEISKKKRAIRAKNYHEKRK
jgi:hypothetical protein